MAARKSERKLATVTLVHPDGREYEASTPRELNNLVAGYGYSIKDKSDLASASEKLAGNVEGAVPMTATTTTDTGTAK